LLLFHAFKIHPIRFTKINLYTCSLQEIVPLNPANIFGAEDTRPVPKWEDIIRETLNRVRPELPKIKSFSDPPSPSKFKPSDDVPDIEEEILLESDSDIGEEVHPLDEDNNFCDGRADGTIIDATETTNLLASDAADIVNSNLPVKTGLQRQFSFPKMFDRQQGLSENMDTSFSQQATKLTRMLSGSERIGLSWPEPPLHLLSQRVLDRPTSFKSLKSFKSSKSFKTYNSFKSIMGEIPGTELIPEIDLEALIKRKRRSSYVRIVSKQMVGIFITVWVRRSLRKHIQNLKVSTVGVGIMGYIGNKVYTLSSVVLVHHLKLYILVLIFSYLIIRLYFSPFRFVFYIFLYYPNDIKFLYNLLAIYQGLKYSISVS